MPKPQLQVQVHNLPSNMDYRAHSPTFQSRGGHRHGSFDDSVSTPTSPSSASDRSWEYTSSPKNRNRRRRRGTKVYKNNPTSPPHDKPMTKNDLYFALDCEVSLNLEYSFQFLEMKQMLTRMHVP